MRKFIYQSIVEKLKQIKDEADNPVIKHFDIWNNNITYIREEQPFYMPAALIEFQTIQWRHQGGGVREAAVTVALHVLTQRNAPTSNDQPYEEQALEFFDLLTLINCCLHGYSNASYNFGHDALTATQSITDNNFEEIQHNVEMFSCHARDASAMPEYEKKKVAVKIVVEIE